ncbi:MAG TPA: citrate synthase [Labilithrix sp.]|nr:citrate synthase [Labilithrix sp.]
MSTTETPTDERVAASGLEDVVAATTRLSDVDGEAGRLVIAGRAVEDLAGALTYEEAIHLLWRGRVPSAVELDWVRAQLAEARETTFERLPDLGDALALPEPMDALRAAAGHLVAGDADARALRTAGDDGLASALRVVGALAVMAAASGRRPPIRPDARASHAADYLRMATGREPAVHEVEALDAYLVTVIDHGMNASTFAARVVASTASDTVSSIVAALGALKGKLHGGAPGPVLDMLDAIGTPDEARRWLERALSRGERIMGMGHRVYRVRDPRAFVLERAIARLEKAREADVDARTTGGRTEGRLRLARAVEREAEALLSARYPGRALRANVEFYTAVLLEAVGLPRTLFTPTFAVARSAGWCAHVEEQRAVGRLIRPQSRYVDALPGRA